MPLSCPIAQPGRPELIELQALLATAPLFIVCAATKRRYRRCCPLLWRCCCHRNDVRCRCDDAVSWQRHNCSLSAPRRSAGTAAAARSWNDVRCRCDDAASWQQHNCSLFAPRRSAGTAADARSCGVTAATATMRAAVVTMFPVYRVKSCKRRGLSDPQTGRAWRRA